jgi:enoyl-CoA hydratase
MGRTVTVETTGRLAVLRLGREHGNAIDDELVRDLAAATREVERDDRVSGVLLAASGKLFCPGLDLRELTRLDLPAMDAFLERFEEMVVGLYALTKPVVAALSGHAVAGGCVLALTCDWRVLREGARIGLAEVRVGLPLPHPVALLLRDAVPSPRLTEIALAGRDLEGDEAVAAGLVHELHGPAGFEAHCLSRLEELASKERAAFAITKRHLRADTLEKMRASDRRWHDEWLDAWFATPTRERLLAIAARLAS